MRKWLRRGCHMFTWIHVPWWKVPFWAMHQPSKLTIYTFVGHILEPRCSKWSIRSSQEWEHIQQCVSRKNQDLYETAVGTVSFPLLQIDIHTAKVYSANSWILKYLAFWSRLYQQIILKTGCRDEQYYRNEHILVKYSQQWPYTSYTNFLLIVFDKHSR